MPRVMPPFIKVKKNYKKGNERLWEIYTNDEQSGLMLGML